MKRILVSDTLSEAGQQIIRDAAGVELDYQPGLSEDQLAEAIKGAHGLVIRSGSKVTAKVIEAADVLAVIGRAGIGVDNVDIHAASKRGIAVMNTPTGNAVTTAEHAIALMMSIARHIPRATASMKAGKWEKKKLGGRELADKTLGVIGLGTIGRIVADRAQGLKMNVIGFDPVLTAERARDIGVELVSLDELWKRADIITVHTPLTPQTKGIINDEVVPKLKKGVLLVNCARGGIYDEGAVARGLESGQIGGAAFDVYPTEPPPPDTLLLQHELVVCTPHLGASTTEAQERVALQVAEQVVGFLTRGEIKNALNVASMTGELAVKVAPWVDLARRLGSFLAQVEPLEPTALEVECIGDAAADSIEPIVKEAAAGYLWQYLKVPVNTINAPHLAKDRGITVREQRTTQASGPYPSQVVLKVTDKNGSVRVAAGALGADRTPRLIRWGEFGIEARLEGTALLVESLDKPGVVGFLGTTLGSSGINVASVTLGQATKGHALSMWNLEQPLPEDTLEVVRASADIARAISVLL